MIDPFTLQPETTKQCYYCGMHHYGVCHKVKKIEYYPDGTVKMVEFHNKEQK
jgi:hypothetical protein